MERIHIDIRLEKAEWPSFAKLAVSLTQLAARLSSAPALRHLAMPSLLV